LKYILRCFGPLTTTFDGADQLFDFILKKRNKRSVEVDVEDWSS
jgi:hypothetical protein